MADFLHIPNFYCLVVSAHFVEVNIRVCSARSNWAVTFSHGWRE
jgi:hypothetical protein